MCTSWLARSVLTFSLFFSIQKSVLAGYYLSPSLSQGLSSTDVRPTALDEIFVISLSYFTLCARSTFRIKFSLQVNRVANAKNTRLFFENATVYFAVIVAILTDLAHRMNNSQVGFLLSLPRDTP